MAADTFGAAEHEKPAWVERIVKYSHELSLHMRREVNEQIAAADQIETGKWRISRHVLSREHAKIANPLFNLKAVIGLVKIAPQAIRTDIGHFTRSIHAGPGSGDRWLADVGA